MSPSGLCYYRPSFVEPIYQKLSMLVADFSEAGDGLSSLVRQGEALQRGRRVLQLSQLKRRLLGLILVSLKFTSTFRKSLKMEVKNKRDGHPKLIKKEEGQWMKDRG